MGNRFDYIDHENAKQLTDMLARADQADTEAANIISSVRYFLKNDQDRIKMGEPSVAHADKQMKGLAAIFNDKKAMLYEVNSQIDKVVVAIEELADKFELNGYTNKVIKLRDAIGPLVVHKPVIKDLIEDLDETKKKHLENLKKKILKAERYRHFKNLH